MASEAIKSIRILEMYHDLLSGRIINKHEAAIRYQVSIRSIQRDIDSIRDYLAEQSVSQGLIQTLEYDKRANGYRLVTQNVDNLSPGQVLAVCKILLESKAFSKEQLKRYLQTVLDLCVSPKEKESVQNCIANELFYYRDPAHPPIDSNVLWVLSEAIRTQVVIEINYQRMKDKQIVKRRVNPVGLLFSEYYFYLMAVIEAPEVRKDFSKKDDPLPTIYRVDRIQSILLTKEHFSIPYSDKFKEGEYKNRIQYMYGGELQKLVFEYYGPSIESVLDRFPMAIVEEKETGIYIVRAEVFGDGVIMWLLSQGNRVKVLEPDELTQVVRNEISRLNQMYN